jgi:hypothetical protein
MIKYVILALIAIALIILGPLATIWALNTLFLLSIAYTFETWLATMILQSIVYNAVFNKIK